MNIFLDIEATQKLAFKRGYQKGYRAKHARLWKIIKELGAGILGEQTGKK